MCSITSASSLSTRSRRPLAAFAPRTEATPKPGRSSDEAPPWPRGPHGRRSVGTRAKGRRVEVMRGFRDRGVRRRQHLVAERARAGIERNVRAMRAS
jgi:hypothetical protein